MKIIFLDIDGVLNSMPFLLERRGTIDSANIAALNYLIELTDAKIVLSSSWRGMIGRGKYCSRRAFAFMLHTHGLKRAQHVFIDTTPHDIRRSDADNDRAKQCRSWLDAHPEVTASVAIDDEGWDFAAAGISFVQTDQDQGLTTSGARKAATYLNITL